MKKTDKRKPENFGKLLTEEDKKPRLKRRIRAASYYSAHRPRKT